MGKIWEVTVTETDTRGPRRESFANIIMGQKPLSEATVKGDRIAQPRNDRDELEETEQ